MAPLRFNASGRRRLILGASAAVVLVGCTLLQTLFPVEEPFGFNHEVHVVGEEMDCSDCHINVEDEDDPGVPVLIGQCMLCHEDIDAEKEPERQIDQLFADGKLARTNVNALADDVIFSHLQHATSDYDCASCHAGVEESRYPGSLEPVTMAACIDCHQGQDPAQAPADACATCHREIDETWPPSNHAQNWTRIHGQINRAGLPGAANDCSLCHTESTCIQCHQQEPPQDHNNFWRQRAHGVLASMDRARCATCHRSDFCVRCHEETRPMNHVGMFGGTKSTHCVSCHFPLQSSSCATCHKGTPSHLLATPLPPGHNPALDCRSCHPGIAPLPHVDKGDSCTICHM